MARKKQKYYVVWKGHHPGIYDSWAECKQHTDGYDSPMFKSFESKEEANLAYRENPFNYIGKKGKKDLSKLPLKDSEKPILYSLSVDAACAGNPGIMEYKGVFTETETQVFHLGPFPQATVNLGEFLALVHALAYLKQHQLDMPVYSDSLTAIAWVRKKKINTKLQPNAKNQQVFVLVERALKWLHANTFETKILKWNTKVWGEIPADFGRK
ncbi:MAG: ribonuclease H [Bacteroidetes bacterium 4572_77]|nr:MAG: ribonuclease H [Bacteroidetes bacterium 4572_77]